MKTPKPLIAAGVALIVVAAIAVVARTTGDGGDAAQRTNSYISKGYTSGLVVHVDPATGEIVDSSTEAVPIALDDKWRNALSTSSEGLEQVPSPVPGGGTMSHLQGRFRNVYVGVVGESGRFGATCNASLPAEGGEADGKPDTTGEKVESGGEGR